MYYHFKASMKQDWTVTDDKVLVGVLPIKMSEIADVNHSPARGVLDGVMQITTVNGKTFNLAYPKKQLDEADEAYALILKNKKGDNAAGGSVVQNAAGKEYRMICNICKKVFTYTDADVKANEQLLSQAKTARNAAVLNILTGNSISGAIDTQIKNNLVSQIRDFSRCPYCSSGYIRELTEKEYADTQSVAAPASGSGSALDEIRKLKELLDIGAVTQEEFDAKKKQLLGL